MKLFSIAICSFLLSMLNKDDGSIYDYSIMKMEGGYQSLASFNGKKVLIISLPIVQNAFNDSLLYSLDTLASAHHSSLAVLGVPSKEEGYSYAMKADLLQWYRSKLGSSISITEGVFTRKQSSSDQHPLFQWLTNGSKNGVFDIDEAGPGTMFFVDEQGRLYSVLRPQSVISGKSVQRVLAQ